MKNADKPINPILSNSGLVDTNQSIMRESYLSGLTKREYFAGLAMQGMLSNSALNHIKEEILVEMAVISADRLLKELEKPTEDGADN